LAAATRIGNILRFAEKEGILVPETDPDSALFEHPSEQDLLGALSIAQPQFSKALKHGKYQEALQALASLRPAVYAFFDAVMVMGDDPAIRNNRLALLGHLNALFQQFADFDRIVTN